MADDIVLTPGDTTVVVTDVVQTLVVVPATTSLVVTAPNPGLVLVDAPNVLILQSDGGSGPAGPAGPAGAAINVVAAQNISAFSAVALNGAGNAYLPSNLVLADATRILGIALTSALIGETFQVIVSGILDTGAIWTPGVLYLSSAAGALTSAPPAAPAYSLWIATAATSSRLIVRPQASIGLI